MTARIYEVSEPTSEQSEVGWYANLSDGCWIGPFSSEALAMQKVTAIIVKYGGVESAAAKLQLHFEASQEPPTAMSNGVASWGNFHMRSATWARRGRETLFFGTHLVERGHAETGQILEALDRQRADRILIGKLARRENLLTREQVYEILNAQRQRHDAFGQIALSLGLLTEAQVKQLLQLQVERTPIGRILVDMGVIDEETLQRELTAFDQNQTPK